MEKQGDRPILADENHNLGFLHRLDVPSSGAVFASLGKCQSSLDLDVLKGV